MIDNPTVCTGEPLVTTLDVESYLDAGKFSHANPNIRRSAGVKT